MKNWVAFQHYRDRSPPWIKLHKSLLDDYKFHCLPVASRALAPCIWLLASESDDGSVAHDPEMIAFRLRMSVEEVVAAIKPLLSAGFLTLLRDASKPLAEGKQDASKELSLARSREAEAETEKNSRASRSGREGLNGAFTAFWSAYPRKKSKGHAEKAWLKIKPDEQLASQIIAAVGRATTSDDWTREGGKFIPHPATWLNGERWEDEIEAVEVIPQKAVAWWASDEGVMTKGRELGIFPRGGEGMSQYKARVVDAARKAA